MSGHSKWANIKHRKAAQDAKRGNLFQKLVRAIIIAAKDGGGDPAMNMRLKTAIERAKAVSVPNDNITRAIKRGTGELGDISYDELTYEAYGPNGVPRPPAEREGGAERFRHDQRGVEHPRFSGAQPARGA